jgi:hypothetical protein
VRCPRATILGRPRRSNPNPARATSTTTGRLPVFLTRTVARLGSESTTRAGQAVNDTGGRAVLVPAAAGTSIEQARTMPAARIIGR